MGEPAPAPPPETELWEATAIYGDTANESFGYSLAVSDYPIDVGGKKFGFIIAGSPNFVDPNPNLPRGRRLEGRRLKATGHRGKASVYAWNGESFEADLIDDGIFMGELEYSYCGIAVAVNNGGDLFAIGCPGDDLERGKVVFMERDSSGGGFILVPETKSFIGTGSFDTGGKEGGDLFGFSIEFASLPEESGTPSYIAIGAPEGNYVRVYIFDNVSKTWTTKELQGPEGSDGFGNSISISLYDGSCYIAVGDYDGNQRFYARFKYGDGEIEVLRRYMSPLQVRTKADSIAFHSPFDILVGRTSGLTGEPEGTVAHLMIPFNP